MKIYTLISSNEFIFSFRVWRRIYLVLPASDVIQDGQLGRQFFPIDVFFQVDQREFFLLQCAADEVIGHYGWFDGLVSGKHVMYVP